MTPNFLLIEDTTNGELVTVALHRADRIRTLKRWCRFLFWAAALEFAALVGVAISWLRL